MRTECLRENPWHLRHPNTFHYQWFKNLQELHHLTEEWAKRFSDHLPKIPALLSTLEIEIQETAPEEFLSELQYTV